MGVATEDCRQVAELIGEILNLMNKLSSCQKELTLHLNQRQQLNICNIKYFRFIYFSGYKTFTNEFIAYEQLGRLIENTETFQNYNGSWVQINDNIYLKDLNQTLFGGVMQVPSYSNFESEKKNRLRCIFLTLTKEDDFYEFIMNL